jgi:hypothetical protein
MCRRGLASALCATLAALMAMALYAPARPRGRPSATPSLTGTPTAANSSSPANSSSAETAKAGDNQGLGALLGTPGIAALVAGLFAFAGAVVTAIYSSRRFYYDVKKFNEMMRTTLTDEVSASTWNVIFKRIGDSEALRGELARAISNDPVCLQRLSEALTVDATHRQRFINALIADEQSRQRITEALICETLFNRTATDERARMKLIEAVNQGCLYNPGHSAELRRLLLEAANNKSAVGQLAELQKSPPDEWRPQVVTFDAERAGELVEVISWGLSQLRKSHSGDN